MTTYSSHSLLIFFFITCTIAAQATVPPSKTFKILNNGDFGDYITEYDASYRYIYVDNFDTSAFPFQIFFYNTTPDAYLLGTRMATPRYEAQKRWVWDANRGNPVRENATLTFGSDGNLVLADVDGRLAWQTGTANKGVVDIQILPTGNLVLLDSRGRFVWQSFDHPSDTLLVRQGLVTGGSNNKLVSRMSPEDASDGPYSFVLEKNSFALYYKSKNSAKPLLYYRSAEFGSTPITSIVFDSEPETDEAFAFDLVYTLYSGNSSVGTWQVARPKFNSTWSMLRLYYDGSLKVETFYANVTYSPWETTYSLFDRDNGDRSECKLPTKCGSLGVCEDNQCVACPTPQGLLGWSRDCSSPKLPSCKAGAKSIDYYKVVGVEHFAGDYTPGDGPVKLADCRERCSRDCGCLGFFYREESSKCFLAPVLGTLSKVANKTHVAYIKTSK